MEIVFILFLIVVVIVVIASFWVTFEKAGKPGWASIIPIYNIIVLLEIAEKPVWYILLLFIPFVGGLIFGFMAYLPLAEKFGKSQGFGVGLVFLPFVFFPILAFGDAAYQGGRPMSRRRDDDY